MRAKRPTAIEFPIAFNDPASSGESIPVVARKLEMLRPDVHEFIEAAQPYRSGDVHHPLWLLQKLWNVDKHRTLHTAGFIFSDYADDPALPTGYASWNHFALDCTKPRREFLHNQSLRGQPHRPLEAQLGEYNGLTRDVALGKPSDPPSAHTSWTVEYPFAGLPLRPVLRQIRGFIETDVVRPIEQLLAGTAA